MILCLDTSTPTCHLTFLDGKRRYDVNWEAGRGLAKGLLEFLERELELQQKAWKDVTGLVVFKGPGSFTGLRIGITVFNTLAYANSLPIVGVTGETWRQDGKARIEAGDTDEIVLPEYGGEANITTPRK
ncbi:MAG: tRNA (adenosine(37)-N6)-threonylcarbamoyltransferase complex dimerization subunit type 1 TsaB [Candidatus Microsaccharimonas sp.]